MDGLQLTIHKGLTKIRKELADGEYGLDDDVDVGAIRDELEDVTEGM